MNDLLGQEFGGVTKWRRLGSNITAARESPVLAISSEKRVGENGKTGLGVMGW